MIFLKDFKQDKNNLIGFKTFRQLSNEEKFSAIENAKKTIIKQYGRKPELLNRLALVLARARLY